MASPFVEPDYPVTEVVVRVPPGIVCDRHQRQGLTARRVARPPLAMWEEKSQSDCRVEPGRGVINLYRVFICP